MSAARLLISDVTFYESEAHQVVWDATPDSVSTGATEATEDAGQLLVRLDVDGQMDIVYADLCQTGDLAAITRAIAALGTVRDGLTQMYAGRQTVGRCLTQGNQGRCYQRDGHDGEHQFPNRTDLRAVQATAS